MHPNNSWVCDGESRVIGWHDFTHAVGDSVQYIFSPAATFQSWDASATMEAFAIGFDSRCGLDAAPLGSAQNLA